MKKPQKPIADSERSLTVSSVNLPYEQDVASRNLIDGTDNQGGRKVTSDAIKGQHGYQPEKYESKIKNLGRLDVLNNSFSHVEDTVNRARIRFANKDHKSHLEAYKDILRALIMQGICKLLEPLVFVRTRPEDKTIVRGLLEQIEKDYEEATGLPVKMYMDEEGHLPKESEGGVVLCSQDNSVSLDNTLSSRLDIIFHQVLPQINQMLYGTQRSVPAVKTYPTYLPTVSMVHTRIENKMLKEGINIDNYSIGRMSIDEHARPSLALEDIDEDSISVGSLFLADEKE